MARFLALHSLPGMSEEQAQQILDTAWAMSGVELQTTYADFDTGRAVCIWQADSAADVEAALEELEVPFEELTEVVEYARQAERA